MILIYRKMVIKTYYMYKIKYNSNKDYLKLLEDKFGRAAKNNMEDTLKIKLKRKLLGD